MKNKKTDEKGYILLESIISLSLISLIAVVYVPFFSQILQQLNFERSQLEMMRTMYGVSLNQSSMSQQIKSGQWLFECTSSSENMEQKVSIVNAQNDEKEIIKLLSVQKK